MRATILDVAALAGVSKATVSRAFINPDAVSPDTRERIFAAAKALQYRPNAIARAMITKRTGNLAFIIYGKQAPVITNPFYGAILESVVRAASDIGYSMFIESDAALRAQSGELMLQKQVDGIIFSSQPHIPMVMSAMEGGTPTVFVNHITDLPGAHCLVCDDNGGMALAVGHLAALGHRRIAMLSGRFTRFIRDRRHRGFLQAMGAHRLAADTALIASCEPTMEAALRAASALLDAPAPPTAVVCTNDTLAVGAMKAALHRGLRLPEDFSVVGFDDSAFCPLVEPELTSVRYDTERMGRLAVECLMAQINGASWPKPVITLEAALVERRSTAPRREQPVSTEEGHA